MTIASRVIREMDIDGATYHAALPQGGGDHV
jgi:hypothetical protein